ncbi:MAG: hypothetical protein ACR2PF_17105 [Rhizobiaceae bacterium]
MQLTPEKLWGLRRMSDETSIFKLTADADGSAGVQDLSDQIGRLAGRPWVMLSAVACKAGFRMVLERTFAASASGSLAGRAIWLDAFNCCTDWDAIKCGPTGGSADYTGTIVYLANTNAKDWRTHTFYGETQANFVPTNTNSHQVNADSDA